MRAFLCGLLIVGLGIGTAQADKAVDWGPYLETPGQQHPIKNDSSPAIAAAATPTGTTPAAATTPAPKAKKASRAKASKPAAEAKTKRPAPARKHHK